MKKMFQLCNEIEYLDLSNFNTSNVTNMSYMFNECHKVKEIKGLNKFNTRKVTDMKAMFQACNVLEYLDLSNFNTDNVTDMECMLAGCYKLEYLNILNFKLKNNCNNNNMFIELNKNCNIIQKFK